MITFENTNLVPTKTIRILVYPNITFQKDLEKDSYIQVIKNQIRLLNNIRNDLWFYMILPKYMNSLAFHNVSQYIMDYPTYPQTMRSHFNVKNFSKIVNGNLDFDLVMSHLPEHTFDVKNVLYNTAHHIPLFFGYSHWFDVRDVVEWPKDSFIRNITGLLEYDRCYLNTQHQKDLVIDQAKETFNENTIQKLDEILTVQHLGVNEEDVVKSINTNPNKVIVFNHRPDKYKHFSQFMELMDKLWSQRKDFSVWIPLLSKPNREYVTTEKGDKQWYYQKLQHCYMGFSPKQTYGGWSVATTDGMMNGVPYIMFKDTYYTELWNKADFFSTDEEALQLLNHYLDNREYRNEMAKKSLSYIGNDLLYKNEILLMSKYIDDLYKKQKSIKNSEKLNDIISWLKKKKVMTKKEIMSKLNWGRDIKWTPYRKALLTNSNIYDSMSEIPTYQWKES